MFCVNKRETAGQTVLLALEWNTAQEGFKAAAPHIKRGFCQVTCTHICINCHIVHDASLAIKTLLASGI